MLNVSKPKVACVIPTYNGVAELNRLLDSLEKQSYRFDTLIVDSSSSDGTEQLARERARFVVSIPASEFNHGGTRQLMVNLYPDYDIYVFLTQDAFLENRDAISRLVGSFEGENVGAACGRQLPHLDATPLATHARYFNYPEPSCIRSLADVGVCGLKTAFISNSFAAYRRKALVAAGGFPSGVILAEDMYVAAKILLAGFSIAYVGEAECRHSHNYSLWDEFRRYFDIGVFHSREAWIKRRFGGVKGEGFRFVASELRFLGWNRCHLWPKSLIRNVAKLVAFRLGGYESGLPVRVKKKISMCPRFWEASRSAI